MDHSVSIFSRKRGKEMLRLSSIVMGLPLYLDEVFQKLITNYRDRKSIEKVVRNPHIYETRTNAYLRNHVNCVFKLPGIMRKYNCGTFIGLGP